MSTPAETQALAAAWAPRWAQGGTIWLCSTLGAGKTTWIQGLLNALGYTGHPKSPSFVLQHLYHLPTLTCEHWDLYRLREEPGEAVAQLFREFGTQGALVVIEWAELLLDHGAADDADILTITQEPGTEMRWLELWTPRKEALDGTPPGD